MKLHTFDCRQRAQVAQWNYMLEGYKTSLSRESGIWHLVCHTVKAYKFGSLSLDV